MNAKTLALDQYNRDRRRLNTRLGLFMVAQIPLPAILLHARFEPLQMLATVVAFAVGAGIVSVTCTTATLEDVYATAVGSAPTGMVGIRP